MKIQNTKHKSQILVFILSVLLSASCQTVDLDQADDVTIQEYTEGDRLIFSSIQEFQ